MRSTPAANSDLPMKLSGHEAAAVWRLPCGDGLAGFRVEHAAPSRIPSRWEATDLAKSLLRGHAAMAADEHGLASCGTESPHLYTELFDVPGHRIVSPAIEIASPLCFSLFRVVDIPTCISKTTFCDSDGSLLGQAAHLVLITDVFPVLLVEFHACRSTMPANRPARPMRSSVVKFSAGNEQTAANVAASFASPHATRVSFGRVNGRIAPTGSGSLRRITRTSTASLSRNRTNGRCHNSVTERFGMAFERNTRRRHMCHTPMSWGGLGTEKGHRLVHGS